MPESAGDHASPSRGARLSIAGPILLILTPIAIAYALLFRVASGVPNLDDYDAIINFCLGWQRLSTLGAKLAYLGTFQHVDYKQIPQELLFVAELNLTHHISIRLLIFLGNLLLLAILFVLWKVYSADDSSLPTRLIRFVPIALLLFSLNYAETVDFAISGLQILPVIFLSLASLYLLARAIEGESGGTFALACGSALLACFTYANGFLLGPIGLFVLVRRKAYLRSLVWCAAFAPPLIPYLWHYTRFPHPGGATLATKLIFFITFLGAGIPVYKIVIPAGLAIFVVYLLAVADGYYRQNLAAFLCATWAMLTAVLVAIGRSGYGLDMARSSRYQIYSDLILIACYGFGVQYLAKAGVSDKRRKQLYVAVLLASILFCARADMFGWHFLNARRQKLMLGLEQYRAAPDVKSPMFLEHPEHDNGAKAQEDARVFTNEAIATGMYRLPDPGK